ncbi:MAG: restriction endonuclease [Micavibrio sp.]|nr:restriction endonuclease [Micavibrio sp.]
MSVPDFQILMLPLLKSVEHTEKSVSEYTDYLSKEFDLSDKEKELTIPSGKQTLIRNRAQWAATYLVKAGLLERHKRGFIRITLEGKKTLEKKLSKIDIEYLMNYEDFKNFKNTSEQDSSDPVENDQNTASSTPEDLIATAYKSYEKTTRDEIIELILNSSPAFFERLIIDLFKAMGYGGKGKTTHVGKSGDGGIDGIINEDPLGLEKIYLQAKRYAPENKIQIDAIRSFSGTLVEQGASKGIFVTTSAFVASAFDYAERIPQSMILIDGNMLTKLMYQYDVGVRIVDTIKLKKVDIDYFEEV